MAVNREAPGAAAGALARNPSLLAITPAGGAAAGPPHPALPPLNTAAASSSEEEDDRPEGCQGKAGPAYDGNDDLDDRPQHCTNCTGALWGLICLACGHMSTHNNSIFQPTVSTAGGERERGLLLGGPAAVLAYDERMLLHEDEDSSHPERPDRIAAIWARLQAAELTGRCRRLPGRAATDSELLACHSQRLLTYVEGLSRCARAEGGNVYDSPDTYVNAHTATCARLSAGGCVDVAVAVTRGQARTGMAIVRPPGHHAESNVAMGFCFYNNAGVAARAAQAAGASRILILDWDVHHGNGTQHIFERDSSVLYTSLHRWENGTFFPGSGGAEEVGFSGGEGFTVNIPWPCGMKDGDYMAAFHHVVIPIAFEFAPDLVIISAGFDAAEGDPIGGCHLSPEVFAHMTAQVQLVAPCVALLEGGYNLLATARCTEACVRVLLGERPPPLPDRQPASPAAMSAIGEVVQEQAPYWRCMQGLATQHMPACEQPGCTLPSAPQPLEETDSDDSPRSGIKEGSNSDADMGPHDAEAGSLGAAAGPGQMQGVSGPGPGSANWAHSSMVCNGAEWRQAQGRHAEAGPIRLQPGASALADDCLLPSAALEPSASIDDVSRRGRQPTASSDAEVQPVRQWGTLRDVPMKTEGARHEAIIFGGDV